MSLKPRISQVLASSLALLLAACQTTFEQGEYHLRGDYVVLEKIGFRGVAVEVPEGFRLIRDFASLPDDDWKREFFESSRTGMNQSEGLDYHFYEPIGFVDEAHNIAILLTPGIAKRLPVTFANTYKEQREEFLRSFALSALYHQTVTQGLGTHVRTTEENRSYAVVSNAAKGEAVAREQRIVLGNSNEFFDLVAFAPAEQRSRINETLENLIHSLNFHPQRLPSATETGS
jgi:hypothetical protein